jgi:hypothetical protein
MIALSALQDTLQAERDFESREMQGQCGTPLVGGPISTVEKKGGARDALEDEAQTP